MKLSRNFKILMDYKNILPQQEKIIKYILDIESFTRDNKKIQSKPFINGRKILEILLEVNNQSSIGDSIRKLSSCILLPNFVKESLYAIKLWGNQASHSIRATDEPYHINFDLHTVTELLKHLYRVVKFFVIEDKNNDPEIWESEYKYCGYGSFSLLEKEEKLIDNRESKEGTSIDSPKARLKRIFDLIKSDFDFYIPIYQRTYSWKNEDIDNFLSDIKDRLEDGTSHYLGSLAFFVNEQNKMLTLIDGQQRITTSLLLMKAFVNFYNETPELTMPNELKEIKTKINSKYRNKSTFFKTDTKTIQEILNDEEFDEDCAAGKAYIKMQSWLKNNEKDVDNLFTTFSMRFIVANIQFNENRREEIRIFENLNTRGRALTQWELIKNFFFKKVKSNFFIDHEKEIDQEMSNCFYSKLVGLLKKYIPKLSKDEKINDILGDFFEQYSRLKHRLIHNTHMEKEKKAYRMFTKVWGSDINDIDSVSNFKKAILEVGRYFDIFCEIRTESFLRDKHSPLYPFRLSLSNLSIKNVHYPLVMQIIYSQAEWSNENYLRPFSEDTINVINDYISDIDKYITRLIVVFGTGQSMSKTLDENIDNSISKSHKRFLSKIKSSSNDWFGLPTIKEFQQNLIDKSVMGSYMQSIFTRLYYEKYGEMLNPSCKIYQIIHEEIKDRRKWFNNQISENVWENKKSKLNKIGNYFLCSKSITKEKQKSWGFKNKVNWCSNDLTFKNKLLSSGLKGELDSLLGMESFDFDSIDKRSEQLAKLIAPLYRLSDE